VAPEPAERRANGGRGDERAPVREVDAPRRAREDEGRFARRLALVAGAAVALAVLYVARHALVLIYLAVLLAVALSPVVRLVERRALRPVGRVRLPRTLAILLVYVAILCGVAGMLALVITPITTQAAQLADDLPALLDRAQHWLLAHGVIQHRIGWHDVIARARAEGVLGTITSTGVGAVGAVFAVVALVFLTFYLLVESRMLFEELLRFVPARRRDTLRHAAPIVTHKVSAWLGGHVLLGLIMAATAAVALGLLGVPYFYVIAVLSFVGEFFPYVGPLLAALPGILIALSMSWSMALWVGLFFLVQQQLENHVLVPQIFERQVGLSAVTVIIAILIGGELLGILGIILAVPSAAIIQVALDELVLAPEREPAPTSR
jgi:predicted PurR-regulated permease PerM